MTDSLFDELFANLSNEEMRERLEQYANQNYQLSIALGRVKQKLRLTEDHLIKTRDRVLDLQRENNALKIARKRTEDKNECLQASNLLTKRCLSMTETHLQSVLSMIERGLSADIEEQPEEPAPTAVLRHDRLKYDTRPHQRLSKAFAETSNMTLSEAEQDDHLTDLPGDDYYNEQHIAAGINIQGPASSATHTPLAQVHSGEGSSGTTRKTRNDDSFVFSQAISRSPPIQPEHDQTQTRVHREHDHLEPNNDTDMQGSMQVQVPLSATLHSGNPNVMFYGDDDLHEDSDYEAYSRDIDSRNDSDSSCDSNESVSGDCDGEMDDMMRRAKKKGPLNDKRISAMSEKMMKSENLCLQDRRERMSRSELSEYNRANAGGFGGKGYNMTSNTEVITERKLSDPLPSSDAEEDEFHDRHAERDRYAYRDQEANKNAIIKESLEARRKSMDSWNATRRRRSCGSLGRFGSKRERPRRRQSGDFSGRGLTGSRALSSQSERSFDAAVAMEMDGRGSDSGHNTAGDHEGHGDVGGNGAGVNGSNSAGGNTGHSSVEYEKHGESEHVRHGRNGRRAVHSNREHGDENARRSNVIMSDSESGIESEKEKERERAHKKKEEEKKAQARKEEKHRKTSGGSTDATNGGPHTTRETTHTASKEDAIKRGDAESIRAAVEKGKLGDRNHRHGDKDGRANDNGDGNAKDLKVVKESKKIGLDIRKNATIPNKVAMDTEQVAMDTQKVLPAALDMIEEGNFAGSELSTNEEDERGSGSGQDEYKRSNSSNASSGIKTNSSVKATSGTKASASANAGTNASSKVHTGTGVKIPGPGAEHEHLDTDEYTTLSLKERLAQQHNSSGNPISASSKDHGMKSNRAPSSAVKTNHRLRRETPPPARPNLVEDEDDGKRRPRRSAAKRKSYVEPPLNKKLRRGMDHTFGTAPKSPTTKVKQKRSSVDVTETKNPSLGNMNMSTAGQAETNSDHRRSTTTNNTNTTTTTSTNTHPNDTHQNSSADTQTNADTHSAEINGTDTNSVKVKEKDKNKEGVGDTESELVKQARANRPSRGGEKPAGKLKSAMVRGNRGGLINRSPLGDLINLR